MKERGIIFQPWEVLATLDGRKTQFRRLINTRAADLTASLHASFGVRCPYGDPGDRLYVKETWAPMCTPDIVRPLRERANVMDGKIYRAGDSKRCFEWRPSIHMPRWASRITLEVTGVRVERLQDISEADALAEGVTKVRDACHVIRGFDYDLSGLCHTSAITPFAKAWDAKYKRAPFDSNPWVWAASFKLVTP